MSIKSRVIKEGIERLGGIKNGEFIAASGQVANRKIDLDILYENNNLNRILFHLATGDLASRIAPHNPDIIVPIPRGANRLGKSLSSRLNIPVAFLNWQDKTPGSKEIQPRTRHYAELIRSAGTIALIDDVFTTGSSLLAVCQMEETQDKEIIAGVVWNRSEHTNPTGMPFPLESVITEHIPLWVEEEQ